MAKFKITACLLSDCEGDAIKDFEFVSNESNSESERIERLNKYPIDGAIEEHDNASSCFIAEDGDGVYLLTKQ